MTTPFDAVTFGTGPAMKNRFMLAPLTNQQSNADGSCSEDEHRWLTMRAQGGFGIVTTCASHVDRLGQGFPGQLGCFSDDHLPGLTRLAEALNATGTASYVQLHHAGNRAPAELVGTPLCPSDDAETLAECVLPGTEVIVTERKDTWLHVRTPGGRAGWALRRWLHLAVEKP